MELSALCLCSYPDSKVHGANIRPTWVLSAPHGRHVGPMNVAIRVAQCLMMGQCQVPGHRWGQSAVYAMVTYPCGDFKVVVFVTLGCTQAPKGIWPLACSEGNHWIKVPTLLIIDRFLPLKVQIPITFSSENYYSDCIVVAKTFIYSFSWGTLALIFMAGCSYWLCKTKNKHSSLWNDQTRQDEPWSKHLGATPLLVNQGGL